MTNANRLIFQTIRALQDRSIDKKEAVELMKGGSLLCIELKPYTNKWWAKRALDVAAISLQEQAELLNKDNKTNTEKPKDIEHEDGTST